MIKHTQLFKHNPPHTYGDCQRTVLACLLDKQPEEIPNFGEHYHNLDGFIDGVQDYLSSCGLAMVSIPYQGGVSLQSLLDSMGNVNKDLYYMVSGTSSNGTNHVVICLNNFIYHDTSIDNSGIVGPCSDGYYWIDFLVPAITKHKKD